MLGYHWLRPDGNLFYDRLGEKVEAGKTYYHSGPIVLEDKWMPVGTHPSGLYFSPSFLQSIWFVFSMQVCRVEVSDNSMIHELGWQGCSDYRKVLWIADATNWVKKFCIKATLLQLSDYKRYSGGDISSAIDTLYLMEDHIDGESYDPEELLEPYEKANKYIESHIPHIYDLWNYSCAVGALGNKWTIKGDTATLSTISLNEVAVWILKKHIMGGTMRNFYLLRDYMEGIIEQDMGKL